MKKKSIIVLFFLVFALLLTGCPRAESASLQTSNASTFEITFIDVGQADAALVACDGEYMLIDAGPNHRESSEQIQQILSEKNIYTLKYLAISHWHEDHYGGLLTDSLKNAVSIKTTLCNNKSNIPMGALSAIAQSNIMVPSVGDTFKLGSAKIHIVDVCAEDDNDSLVLLIEYGQTRFLFTGDIEKQAQSRVADTLRERYGWLETGTNLIKMPHHGAYNSDPNLTNNAWDNSLNTLLTASYATYFVISVGPNSYGHPDSKTLQLINDLLEKHELHSFSHLFRTDRNGNIVVFSDGKELKITTQK